MAQVHNGDVGGHRDRTSEACFPKQEKWEVENRIPREPSSCRAEDGSQGQENGFLPGREELDSEKDLDNLTTARKKRGRRKLERPTKCEFFGFCLFSFSVFCYDLYVESHMTESSEV